MDPLKQATEHHIHIQDFQHQEQKITKEQERILFQISLANVLLFGAWTLNPEQQIQQKDLTKKYLTTLVAWDTVEIWLQWCMPYHAWIVVSNDGQIIKIKSSCYLNKKKKEWIRSFSTKDWTSKWFIIHQDERFDETKIQRFFIVIPQSHTVKSTAWIPQEALDEINEIYKQAGDEKTCYDLVNNLTYWNPENSTDSLPF
jgi:hypothetical protein